MVPRPIRCRPSGAQSPLTDWLPRTGSRSFRISTKLCTSSAAPLAGPSIYAASGDKRSLYLKTLERYREQGRAMAKQLLADDPPLSVYLTRFYDAALDIYFAGEKPSRDCYSIGRRRGLVCRAECHFQRELTIPPRAGSGVTAGGGRTRGSRRRGVPAVRARRSGRPSPFSSSAECCRRCVRQATVADAGSRPEIRRSRSAQ